MRIALKPILHILFVFACIFAPPILPINLLFILAIIPILFFLRNPKVLLNDIKCILGKTRFFILLLGYIYVLFIMLLNMIGSDNALLTNRITVIYQICVLMPLQLVVADYIVRKHNSKENIYQSIISAGGIQGILALITFLFPSIRTIFLSFMERNNTVYGNETMMSYRGYGFASTLLDTFGYGMGLIAGLILLSDCKQKRKNKLSFLLIVFAIAMNSRTGFAILAVAVVFYLFRSFKEKVTYKQFRKILSKSIPIIIIVVFFLTIFRKQIDMLITNISISTTFQWIIGGFTSIYNFVTGTEAAYQLGSMQNSMFTSRFWQIPESMLGLLFGEGHSAYGVSNIIGFHSDVGYINYIWIVGIVGMILLICFIISVFMRIYKLCTTEQEKFIILFLIVSFLLMMIKGNVITYCIGTFVSILILVTIAQKNSVI